MKKIYLKPQSRLFSVDAENLMAGSLGDNDNSIVIGDAVITDGDTYDGGYNENQFARGDNGYWDYEW